MHPACKRIWSKCSCAGVTCMQLQTEWLAADCQLWVGASTACQAGGTILTSARNGIACRSSIKGGRGTGAGGCTWASVQTSSAGLSERQPTLRGPCLQLLKAMGMSSANGRLANSWMTLPVLQPKPQPLFNQREAYTMLHTL